MRGSMGQGVLAMAAAVTAQICKATAANGDKITVATNNKITRITATIMARVFMGTMKTRVGRITTAINREETANRIKIPM